MPSYPKVLHQSLTYRALPYSRVFVVVKPYNSDLRLQFVISYIAALADSRDSLKRPLEWMGDL